MSITVRRGTAPGMVQRHAMGHPAAPVVADQVETSRPSARMTSTRSAAMERLLNISSGRRGVGRLLAVAIAAQVGHDEEKRSASR